LNTGWNLEATSSNQRHDADHRDVPRRDVHGALRHLRLRHRLDALSRRRRRAREPKLRRRSSLPWSAPSSSACSGACCSW